MINGFDEETSELNSYEAKTLLPLIVAGLETKNGKSKAVTSTYICKKIKERGEKINPARLRKIIHEIRITGLVENLIATSKGYYICTDKKEMQKYVDSLHQRENSIASIRNQLIFQMNKL